MHLAIPHISLSWRGYIFAMGIGALCVCGQAPLHLWGLSLIGFAGLYMGLLQAAKADNPRKSGFLIAFFFALGYFGASIFWVGSAFIARGPAFIALMPPMVLGLAMLLAIFWAIAGSYFAVWHSKSALKPFAAILLFTALFTLAELARGHIFGGLPWNLPGYIFPAGSAPSQIAVWINIYGLSFLVLLMAAALGASLQQAMPSFKASDKADARGYFQSKMIGIYSLPLVILAVLYGYGHYRLSNAESDSVDGVNIRLVQVNFNQADQFDPVKSRQILQRLFDLSLAPGLEQVTHIVWPEGAVLGLAMQDYNFLESMGRALVQVDDTPPIWLLQSLRHQSQTDPKTGRVRDSYYNSAVAVEFDAQGRPTIAAYNDKHRLVPFGEFIPGGDWIADNLPVISASLSSLSPAPQKTLSNFPGLPRLSAQICYEAIFPGLMPRDEKNPAQLILTQSNDAWYGRSWGPWQHANIARYRAIEQGVPMIRVAANGISGIVNAYGQMPRQLTMKSESHIDTTLPKYLNINKKTKLNSLILGLLNLIIALLCSPLFHARQHS